MVDNFLNDQHNNQSHVIRMSDMQSYYAYKGRNLITFLIYAKPPITEIIHDCYPNPALPLFSELVKYFPNIKKTMLHGFEKIDLDASSIVDRGFITFLQSNPCLKTLKLQYVYISSAALLEGEIPAGLMANSLPNLEVIDLEQCWGFPLNIILKAAPNLKALSLSGPGSARVPAHEAEGQQFLALEKDSLLSLEEINFSSDATNFSTDDLTNLLEAAPNLSSECRAKLNELITKSQIKRAAHPSAPVTAPIIMPQNQPSNPKHHTETYKDLKPLSEKTPFQFKGTNKTKNQGMVIEKLSQYLNLEQKHLGVIPRIQKGICLALVHYAETMRHKDWMVFLEQAVTWNGQHPLPKALQEKFETLVQYILKYQLSSPPETKFEFLGDAWEQTLIKQRKPYILINPWHAIRIEPVGQNQWRVYDPNYVTDPILVSEHDLADTVTQAIGKLISIKSNTANVTPVLKNHQDFIAEGGLFTLCQNTNTDALIPRLAKTNYSKQALDGLLLRNTAGEPAWFMGLENRNKALNQLTHHLLQQFISANPNDYIEQLTRSLEHLTPVQKNECITKLIQSNPQTKSKVKKSGSAAPLERLISDIRANANAERFDKQLQTWDKQAQSVDNLLEYCQSTCAPEHQKRLIEVGSAQQVNTLRLNLQSYANSTHRPVFYVHSPEDLVCSAPYIKRHKDNTGTIHKGPGGVLYDFLQKNRGKKPIIIVNYAQFHADDLVRFNGLLDKTPHADGTNLPSGTQIIGLMNRNHPDCYQGSDFYSRFDTTEICPLSEAQWQSAESQFKYADVSPGMKPTIIELFHAPDWKERLLGRWVLDGDMIHFEEGELVKAVALGRPIQIQHGLWDDEAFQRVLQDAIPSNIPLIKPLFEEPYLWDHLCSGITTPSKKVAPHIPIILNPTCLGNFLSRYELDEKTHSLIKKPGLLQEAINSRRNPLNIFVTRTLSDDEWAMILTESKRLGLRLHVEAAPDVLFPSPAFQSVKQSELQINPKNSLDKIYVSTDMDTTVDLLNHKSDHIVIDVTECSAADLLLKIDGELNLQSQRFEFKQSLPAVSEAMRQGKKVILKGQFSRELSDELAMFLQKRQQTVATGQLIVVADDNEVFRCFSNRRQHTVTVEEKKRCLKEFRSITAEQLADESLSKLKARRDAFKINPGSQSSDETWIGMQSLDGLARPSLGDFDVKTSSAQADAFIQQRRQAVNRVLQYAPYVFLSGLTGVGKSTFVEQELSQENDKLFFSESNIKDWALDKSNKRKLLFLDEANLSSKQWSEFEGLFNSPPHILVDGKLYPLSPNHKVIFAGNPVSYGDERSLAPFFARHGNAVLFSPLSLAVIYEKILKPVCDNQAVSLKAIAPHILKTYRFLCDCSQTEILISPRELQMLALLSIAYAKKHPKANIQNIIEHFSYAIAKNLVPKENLAEFEELFKPDHTLTDLLVTDNKEFHTTPSRHAILQQLDDLLSLSAWKKQQGLNETQRYGGLGGIVIEGAPGIGKSELVTHSLVAHGYQEEKDYKNPSLLEKPFYRISASLSPNEKEALLLKAFHEGAIVVIDEINSSPMLERLLNNLLMGKTPDNQRPRKPGFLVIGTQNPVTMAGRRAASAALQRRLMAVELPEYSNNEMKVILIQKGVNALDADIMVNAYEKNRTHAIQHHLIPIPTFRDLMRVAENELKALDKPVVQKTTSPILQQQQREASNDAAHQAELALILARLYQNGVGVSINYNKALDLVKLAKKLDSENPLIDTQIKELERACRDITLPHSVQQTETQVRRNNLLPDLEEAFLNKIAQLEKQRKYEEVFDLLTEAVTAGNTQAYVMLSTYLMSDKVGSRVPHNLDLARQFLEIGIEAGEPLAAFDLAQVYERGIGVTTDYRMALKLYQKAQQLDPDNPETGDKIQEMQQLVAQAQSVNSPAKKGTLRKGQSELHFISESENSSVGTPARNQRTIRQTLSKLRHAQIPFAREASIRADNTDFQRQPISPTNTTVDLKKRLRALNVDANVQSSSHRRISSSIKKAIPENVITQTSLKERFMDDVVRDVHEALTHSSYIENCRYQVIETTPKRSYLEVSTTEHELLLHIKPEKVKVYSKFTKDPRLDDFQKAVMILMSMGIPPEFPEELDISKPKSPLGLAVSEAFDFLKRQYAAPVFRQD